MRDPHWFREFERDYNEREAELSEADSRYEEFLIQRDAEIEANHKAQAQILSRRQSHRAGITAARSETPPRR